MHSEFACEFIIQSNHDHSNLEITFRSAQNSFCLHHRIKNCSTLEIGVQCIQNLHVNSQYSQLMTTLPQKLLFVVHRNIIRYFHFGPVEKPMNQITAIFVDMYYKKDHFCTQLYIQLVYKAPLSFTFKIIGNGNNQTFQISMSPQHAWNAETNNDDLPINYTGPSPLAEAVMASISSPTGARMEKSTLV